MSEFFNYSMCGLVSCSLSGQIGAPRHKTEKEPTFEEEAIEELTYELKSSEIDENGLFIVYRKHGYYYYAKSDDEILKASLVPQDFICQANLGFFDPCTITSVFYRKNGEFKLLYRSSRYFLDKKPMFLSKSFLISRFKKIFSEVSIKLGELHYKTAKHIAWKLTTEKGVFYITWHNGLPLQASDNLTFEEKSYEQLRNVYSILRFHEGSPHSERDFTVVCG